MSFLEWLEQPIFTTIALAIVLVSLSIAGLALGWFLTGKSKIVKGACGLDPKKRKELEECGKLGECDLCRPPSPEKHHSYHKEK